jgi:hypothetical protein
MVKVFPVHALNHRDSVEAWFHSLAAMEVNGQLHAPSTLTPVSNECDARLASDVLGCSFERLVVPLCRVELKCDGTR